MATSLDGYIAGPKGEFDWIITDPEIDFGALYAQFDTLLVGRRTFEMMSRADSPPIPDMKVMVFSRTLRQIDHPNVTVVAEKERDTLAAVRAEQGKDIWLFGGGLLFRSLLEAEQVDTVEIAVIPVLLGGGIPMLPPPAGRTRLTLTGRREYTTGIVSLQYAVERSAARRPP